MLFSVIIPVYNVEKYLKECLESIINQTYINFEIILINDGSTDRSREICEIYAQKDNRIKIFNNKNNGLLYTRRFGIEKSTGDYLMFLDSDDYWDSNTLEEINKGLKKTGADLLLFNYKKVDRNGNLIYFSKTIFDNYSVFENENKLEIYKVLSSSSNLNNLVCKVVKRSLISADNTEYIKYRELKNSEDLLQSLPLFKHAQKITYLNEYFYNYRQNEESITSKINYDLITDISVSRELLLNDIKELKFDTQEILDGFYGFYRSAIYEYAKLLCYYNVSLIDISYNMKNIDEISLFKQLKQYFVENKGKYALDSVLLKTIHQRKALIFFLTLKITYYFKKNLSKILLRG